METPTTTPPYQPTPNPTPPAAQTPPVIISPKPSHAMRVVLMVLGGIVVLAGAAYGWMKLYPSSPVAQSPTPSASVDPTAGWKTYTNAQYGFELTLTDAWKGYKVFSSSGSQGVGAPNYFEFTMPTSDKTKCVTSVTEEVCGYADIMNVTVFSKAIWDELTSTAKAGVTILGQNASVVILGNASSDALPNDLNDKNFDVSQILSTFKFTDPTAGWKTYTDGQLGYEFRYPSDWKLSTNIYTESGGLKRTIRSAEVVPAGMEPLQESFTVTQSYQTLSQVKTSNANGVVTTIAGRSAYKYSGTGSQTFVFLETPGLLLALNGPEDVIIQILSTFKFTK